MSDVQTDYLGRVFDPKRFGQTVCKTLRVAHQVMEKDPFDSIAFTGVSGSAMAFILAAELKVALLCVRKKGDDSHYRRSSGLLEGYLRAKRYLFVDDFISSGSTYKRVMEFLKEKLPQAECVGALTYAGSSRDNYLELPVYPVVEYSDESYQLTLPCLSQFMEFG